MKFNMLSVRFVFLLASWLFAFLLVAQERFVQYVDTRVGTAAATSPDASIFGKKTEVYGQVLPAVLEPNGMNFWTPQTQDTELKGRCPYYYTHERIQGFRNSHWLVGGATQDYGSFTLMPLSGVLKCGVEERASSFRHTDEVATPSYYSVRLLDYDVQAEMTGLSRSGIFRFTYEGDGDRWLVVNPNSDEGQGYIEIDTRRRQIRGYNPVHRIYQGKGLSAGFRGYFVLEYQGILDTYGTFHGDRIFEHRTRIADAAHIGVYLKFRKRGNNQVVVKVGTSFTSMEAAGRNLHHEIPHWDFDYTRWQLNVKWENRLSRVRITGSRPNDKSMFYGALYRASFLPRTVSDVDGTYPAFSEGIKIMKMPDGTVYYDDFSLWDTYRALHPFLTIFEPKKTADMMQSLVLKSEQGGWLPIFPCWGSYTSAMIGDHAISVISDAYLKGIHGFDIEKAYAVMRKNAFEIPLDSLDYINGCGRRSLVSYMQYGYIPLEDSVPYAYHRNEQVSRTLEYAYDDYVLALLARSLGKSADYDALIRRSVNYRNVFLPQTGWVQGRYADGSFIKSDNVRQFCSFITEGSPAHYSFYVPHDIGGVVKIMGGHKSFIQRLESLFTERLYWHGNEPCHHIPYLFAMTGEAWRTQKYVSQIMDLEYSDSPGGLSGNDDAGQMSAWYIFSALGFYPVCPGTPYYIIGTPRYEKISISLENGAIFTVKALNGGSKNIYIQYATLNGKILDRPYITHDEIMHGGTLEFLMGDKPNKKWGRNVETLLSPKKY